MSNILNHNRNILETEIDFSEYWDFHISLENNSFNYKTNEYGLYDKKCISYIDFSDDKCIKDNEILSKRSYIWNKCISNGFLFNNIGYTGVDNGFLKYDKTTITNKDFLNIFLNSKFKKNRDDCRLTLYKIDGNNQIYDYDSSITEDGLLRLNGGFYQGFWKTEDNLYQVLPDNIGNGITLDFTLNMKQFESNGNTLNDSHENNKGIFFYIGTRAENKWWKYYLIDDEFDKCAKDFFGEDYIDENYYKDTINDNYTDLNNDDECDNYVSTDYIEDDIDIDENEKLETDNNMPIDTPYLGYDIKTDNKFLLFNRTKEGFTTENWDENVDVILEGIKKPNIGNYFLLFNRTKEGFTTENINNLISEKSREYNVNDDIYENAFCLQINEKGEIGYKYLVRDCDNIGKYKIIKEFSKYKLIDFNKWYPISITFEPIIPIDECYPNNPNNRMVIKIYINGKLKFISKELPMFNFRKLNDAYEKQEGVPFNISIGGGTQGLCDVIYLNYMKEPDTILPLEKEFCGTFIGYLKTFRIHNEALSYQEIVDNHNFENKLLSNINIYNK